MSDTFVKRPLDARGAATIQHRLTTRRQKPTESNEWQIASQNAALLAAVRRKNEQAIEAHVNAELGNSLYLPVRCVSCEVYDSVLFLQGRVPSFYMKQIAQEFVRQLLDGSLVIDNQLEVDRT